MHPCLTEPTDSPSCVTSVGSHRWHVACKSVVLKCNRCFVTSVMYSHMHVLNRCNVDN